MSAQQPVKVLAVTSGKGGVGKSSVSANLAIELSNAGKKVLLMDADLGLANIDVMLNLSPTYNLEHVISGQRSLEEVMIDGPAGIKVLPAASGVQNMAALSSAEHYGLIQAFSELSQPIDTLIIDTAAGLAQSATAFTRAAREVVVMVCDEPASITDAYATVKVLSQDYNVSRFHILVNMVRTPHQADELFEKLSLVTHRFLDVTLKLMGSIPYDENLLQSVQQQKAVVDAFPQSQSSRAFKKLVQDIEEWPIPLNAGGHLEFFVERLIQYSATEYSQLS